VRSKYSNVVILLAAILAMVPVLAVHYLFDNYVHQRETTLMQRAVDNLGGEIEDAATEAIASLQRIVDNSPSLCTPTFIANVRQQMQSSLHLRQVLVESAQGAQYCDAFGGSFAYAPLSDSLPVPGRTETVAVVKVDGLEMPLLKITQAAADGRRVSAFVPLLAYGSADLLGGFRPARFVSISLPDGAPVLTVGRSAAFDGAELGLDLISTQSVAGEIPLRVRASVRFSTVHGDYSSLNVAFTLVAGAVSAAFLLLILQYARRASLPAFDLERAIVHGELKPYYQPVIDLSTGRLAGCEMLCRWVKKDGKIIPPGAFIDQAEATGLAIPMTVSLMQQVRADLGELCRDMPDIKISINLFEGHFRDGSIIDDVQAIFGGSPIRFEQLVFEITERRPLGNSKQAHAVIAGLHALGAKLAMDDVGTGHSNLAYLQTLGVDVIKIDRIFVDMVKPDTVQVPVLDGLIAVARDLGTEVVAEGVETEAQALYLRARGVHMAQGFLFAPALKAKSFKELAWALNPVPATATSSSSVRRLSTAA
jgi:EAL domain-containing protein (putative c-di-GMP-specific phosphodiesterase class I)